MGEPAYKTGRLKEAGALFKALAKAKTFEPFLTIPAHKKIV